MDGISPRSTIPDAWAEKGRCPLCQAARLRVLHTAGAPDQLACARCGLAFELEAGGARLRVRALPARLSAPPALTQAWLSAADLGARLRPAPPPANVPAPATLPEAPGGRAEALSLGAEPLRSAQNAPPPEISNGTSAPLSPEVAPASPPVSASAPENQLASCSQAELLTRAQGLLALGNSPLQIQVMFVQSGIVPEVVSATMAQVRQLAQQRRDRQVRLTWRLGLLTLIVLVLAVGGGLLLIPPSRSRPAATGAAGTAGPTPIPNLTAAAGYLLALPTAVVQTEPAHSPAARPKACPASADEAASVFGGEAKDWVFKADVNGWSMTSLTTKSIFVPAGMTGGYFQITSNGAAMDQVPGPARLQNINFIAITCP